MGQVIVGFHEGAGLSRAIAGEKDLPWMVADTSRFPDGEIFLRFPSEVAGHGVVLAASLFPPNESLLEVAIAAETARRLGAVKVTLLAPYLAYMRQDAAFQPGEAVTSRIIAGLLGDRIDRLITVDPHLHRHHSLDEIYRCQTTTLSAASLISDFIANNVEDPVVVGPDVESGQWVTKVADPHGLPRMVLSKTRLGPRDVEVAAAGENVFENRTAVIVDDIISTARTMVETVETARERGARRVVCIGVHALFVEDAYRRLIAAGADEVVTTDAIPHATNRIPLAPLLAEAL